jgi:hypothetical protein
MPLAQHPDQRTGVRPERLGPERLDVAFLCFRVGALEFLDVRDQVPPQP